RSDLLLAGKQIVYTHLPRASGITDRQWDQFASTAVECEQVAGIVGDHATRGVGHFDVEEVPGCSGGGTKANAELCVLPTGYARGRGNFQVRESGWGESEDDWLMPLYGRLHLRKAAQCSRGADVIDIEVPAQLQCHWFRGGKVVVGFELGWAEFIDAEFGIAVERNDMNSAGARGSFVMP